jgi:hypothetical protein
MSTTAAAALPAAATVSTPAAATLRISDSGNAYKGERRKECKC